MTTTEGLEAVEARFRSYAEADPTYSAQLAVRWRGEPVVALAAGSMAADSLLPVYSSSKGATGIVVALLVERGQLDLDATVATYWPEFAQRGKASITVRQLLSHQAGLPGVDGGFTWDELIEHDALAARLAAQRPYWRPGAAVLYHALTIGTLADEIVRRIDGRSVAAVLADDVTRPRGIDLWLGTPASEDGRVVAASPPTAEEVAAGPLPVVSDDPINAIALPRGGALDMFSDINSERVRRAGIPAASALATADGLASMYTCLRHPLNGQPRLLSDDTISQVSQIEVAGLELGTDLPVRFGVLFQVPCPPRWSFGGLGAFGHDGAGGSLAFCDPRADMAFGYTVQRLPLPGGMDARAVELARLARRALRGMASAAR